MSVTVSASFSVRDPGAADAEGTREGMRLKI